MSCFVYSRWGDCLDDPSESKMREVLAELDVPDPEHPDAWMTHESGWTLSIFFTRLLHLEQLGNGYRPAVS